MEDRKDIHMVPCPSEPYSDSTGSLRPLHPSWQWDAVGSAAMAMKIDADARAADYTPCLLQGFGWALSCLASCFVLLICDSGITILTIGSH